MAFGRLQHESGTPPMSDINMTPLIDVMLVLLVIFMVAAPLMVSGLPLELPRSDAAQPAEAPAFVSVAVDAEGRVHLGDEPVDLATLAARIGEAARRDVHTEVQLRADARVPYGRVAELIGAVQKAGLTRIGLVTEPPAAPAR
jgi:biopolymer transport protein ExbD/biopolymer transport protein TolR